MASWGAGCYGSSGPCLVLPKGFIEHNPPFLGPPDPRQPHKEMLRDLRVVGPLPHRALEAYLRPAEAGVAVLMCWTLQWSLQPQSWEQLTDGKFGVCWCCCCPMRTTPSTWGVPRLPLDFDFGLLCGVGFRSCSAFTEAGEPSHVHWGPAPCASHERVVLSSAADSQPGVTCLLLEWQRCVSATCYVGIKGE